MQNQLIIKNVISIKAPANIVWEVLTDPEQTKKYMFGCETVSDWSIGGELLWRGNYEDQVMVFVKGTIANFDPPHLLAYTTFDPNSTMEDKPENYLTVTYQLKEENGHTELTVTQGDYHTVADGERRYKEAHNGGEGWNPIMAEIKKIAEGMNAE